VAGRSDEKSEGASERPASSSSFATGNLLVLETSLRARLQAPSYTPPPSPVIALQLVQMTLDPKVALHKVRAVVESDPLIAAQLLGLAQSAYYARGGSITSLDDAISRLGLKAIGDLFLQATLSSRVFFAPGFEENMRRLRVHSIVTAHVARLICRRAGLLDDWAFLCGLLHDVGMAAVIGLVAFKHVEVGDVGSAEVESLTVAIHEDAGAVLGKMWRLPEAVQRVLTQHHQFYIGGETDPLAAAICLADSIAARVGAGMGAEHEPQDVEVAAQFLGVSHEDLDAIALAGENFVSMA
jgi:HD-like signal output (HDOD) protein